MLWCCKALCYTLHVVSLSVVNFTSDVMQQHYMWCTFEPHSQRLRSILQPLNEVMVMLDSLDWLVLFTCFMWILLLLIVWIMLITRTVFMFLLKPLWEFFCSFDECRPMPEVIPVLIYHPKQGRKCTAFYSGIWSLSIAQHRWDILLLVLDHCNADVGNGCCR